MSLTGAQLSRQLPPQHFRLSCCARGAAERRTCSRRSRQRPNPLISRPLDISTGTKRPSATTIYMRKGCSDPGLSVPVALHTAQIRQPACKLGTRSDKLLAGEVIALSSL